MRKTPCSRLLISNLTMRKTLLSLFFLSLAGLLQGQPLRLLTGCYNDDDPSVPGACLLRFDPGDGSTEQLAAAPTRNPSFIIPSADGRFAWSVCEFHDGTQGAYAYRLSEDSLEALGFQSNCPDGTGGGDPCNILFLNGFILTSDYTGGAVSVFPVLPDGTLGALLRRFDFGEGSHIHCCRISPDGRYVFASDLGCDVIRRFPIQPGEFPVGEPEIAWQATPGCGPRHFVFSADGRFCYMLGELGDTLTVLRYEDGTLTPVQELKAYRGRGKGSADIHLSPDGRFLYTSHRLRRDGIATFRVDPQSGRVRRAGFRRTGTHPRNFAISPDGRWLLCACRDADAIELYAIRPRNGRLRRTGRAISLHRPVCVQIL